MATCKDCGVAYDGSADVFGNGKCFECDAFRHTCHFCGKLLRTKTKGGEIVDYETICWYVGFLCDNTYVCAACEVERANERIRLTTRTGGTGISYR